MPGCGGSRPTSRAIIFGPSGAGYVLHGLAQEHQVFGAGALQVAHGAVGHHAQHVQHQAAHVALGLGAQLVHPHGRYALGNQPGIAQWNVARLAETLMPLLADDTDAAIAQAQAAIDAYPDIFERAYTDGLRRKLGLLQSRPDDLALANDLLERMTANRADMTSTFRGLCTAASDPSAEQEVRALFADPAAFDEWAVKWRQRLAEDGGSATERTVAMRSANPAFIPRNHLVEEAIAAAVEGDFTPFEQLIDVLAQPYADQPERQRYAAPPRPEQVVHQTFCGT